MDPLDNTGPSLEILRRRMQADLKRLQSKGSGKADTAASTPQARAAGSPAKELREAVRQSIRALDAQDPRFTERATDAFVEAVLRAEFGSSLVNQTGFRQTSLDVAQQLQADDETAALLRQVITELRRP